MRAPNSNHPDCVRCNDRRLFCDADRNRSSAMLNICWNQKQLISYTNVYTRDEL